MITICLQRHWIYLIFSRQWHGQGKAELCVYMLQNLICTFPGHLWFWLFEAGSCWLWFVLSSDMCDADFECWDSLLLYCWPSFSAFSLVSFNFSHPLFIFFFRIIFLIISGTFFENKMYICMKHKMPIRLRGWLLWPQESYTSKPLRKMVQIKIVIFWLYLPRLYFFLVFPYSNFLWHLNPSVS